MGKVIGIGGVFYKAADKDSLLRWYKDVLGVEVETWGHVFMWNDKPDGMTVWSIHKNDTKHFDPSRREFMLNLIVEDLPSLLDMLRQKGANVLDRYHADDFGKFGYVLDPEDTLI